MKPSKTTRDNEINLHISENFSTFAPEIVKWGIVSTLLSKSPSLPHDYISKWTRYLYWNLCILNETTGNSNDYTDSVRSIVKDSMDKIEHLQNRIDYVLKMLKLGYDKSDLNPKLSPLMQVMQDSLDLIGIWHETRKKMSEYNFEDFGKYVNLKKQEADILFQINTTQQ